MPDLCLRDRGAGDVGADAAEPGQLPRLVVDRPAADLEMALLAIGACDLELEALEGTATDQVRPVTHPGLVVDQGTARPPGRPLPGQLDQGVGRLLRYHPQVLVGIDLPGPFR